MGRFSLYSSRVLYQDELCEATITINNDKIEFVEWGHAQAADRPTENLGDAVIMPGLIDSHVHINEPGRTEWEGFDTATRAAALGGITTLIDMPLNSTPVTTTKKALDQKIEAAKKSIHVNCGFYGGLVPGNLNHMASLIESGVFGIKAFLVHSGIDDFPNATEKDIRAVMPILKQSAVPLLVHSELESQHPGLADLEKNPTSYKAYLGSRPKSWEDNAISLMIGLCKEFKSPVHIVHLSSSNSINPLRDAINNGIPISVETCPHYLFFNAEDIGDKQTLLKCAPPIREKANNELIWEAVKTGTISFIVTDHSPAPPEMKGLSHGDFRKAWGGVAGVQFSLPVVWTKAKENGITLPRLSQLMSGNVAEFLGLVDRKGKIEKGFDADLVVWRPEKEFKVTKESIAFRHKITPYEGQRLFGVVERTYVSGKMVADQGKLATLNQGRILTRKYK